MLLLISLLSFFLPTQLALHVDNLQTTVYGFQIDYLIPTIYLTDLIILLIIILGIRKIKFNKKYLVCSILYIAFAFSNILVSSYLVPSVYKWLKLTELIFLGLIIKNTKKFDVFKHFIKPLSYSMIIVCILGILQFVNKGSIGGLFYWLGERKFLFSDPNVSPFPYSIFSHPNSFAGFLLVFLIFLFQYKKKFNIKYFLASLFLSVINLILTNSLNVYLVIAFLIFIRFSKHIHYSLFIIHYSERFITHRVELIKAALTIIKENWLLGVGLNNFIPNLPKITNTFLNAWELQPVHNIFLLVFSEVGIFGLIAFLFLFFNLTINHQLLAIVLTGLSDHYWLTLQQNMLLFTYVLAVNYKWKKKI